MISPWELVLRLAVAALLVAAADGPMLPEMTALARRGRGEELTWI